MADEKFYLLKYQADWADEMDVYGLAIKTATQLANWKKKIPESFVHHIGTNEEIEYDVGLTVLDDIEEVEISAAEFNTFRKTLGSDYGHFPSW